MRRCRKLGRTLPASCPVVLLTATNWCKFRWAAPLYCSDATRAELATGGENGALTPFAADLLVSYRTLAGISVRESKTLSHTGLLTTFLECLLRQT